MGSWMMRHLSWNTERNLLNIFVFLAISLCLTSCGNDPQRPGTISNGNWWVSGKSTGDPSRMFYAAGPLVQTDNSVTGTVRIGNRAADYLGLNAQKTIDCFSMDDTVTLAGSFSGKILTLTGTSSNGGSLTLVLEGPADRLSGTYKVEDTAGCTGTGTVTAAVVHPLNGTWTGSINYLDGVYSGFSVTIQITEGNFNTTNGNSPITGLGTIYMRDPNNPSHVTPSTCTVGESFVTGDHVVLICPPFGLQGTIVDPHESSSILSVTSMPLGTTLLTRSN